MLITVRHITSAQTRLLPSGTAINPLVVYSHLAGHGESLIGCYRQVKLTPMEVNSAVCLRYQSAS